MIYVRKKDMGYVCKGGFCNDVDEKEFPECVTYICEYCLEMKKEVKRQCEKDD